MKIGIIGAGFTGLAAAYSLVKQGHEVFVFEKDPQPGGLAIGYKEKGWNWTLEKHYHHWFTNDSSVLTLAQEIGYNVIITRPKTSSYVKEGIYQLDSPGTLLKFPLLPLPERIRMGMVLAMLKFNPVWQPLEKYKTGSVLPRLMGMNGYSMLWEPLMNNKFGKYANEVSLAWFWARIAKRTPSLAYPEGGFLQFAQALVQKIKDSGGDVLFQTEIKEIKNSKDEVLLKFKKIGNCPPASLDAKHLRAGKLEIGNYDAVVVTLPSPFFIKITPQLPQSYRDQLMRLKWLGAINIVLRLKKEFFKDGTYWLSVCDKHAPVMAIVEHTHFMDKKQYNNENLVYLGNYLPADHKYFSMNKDAILKIYDPFLQKISPGYNKSVISFEAFKASFAQPIIPVNYSKIMPDHRTPLANVYLANIQQVYPWDRGTNYAIELGEKVSRLL